MRSICSASAMHWYLAEDGEEAQCGNDVLIVL
jgi:hypothetical protein